MQDLRLIRISSRKRSKRVFNIRNLKRDDDNRVSWNNTITKSKIGAISSLRVSIFENFAVIIPVPISLVYYKNPCSSLIFDLLAFYFPISFTRRGCNCKTFRQSHSKPLSGHAPEAEHSHNIDSGSRNSFAARLFSITVIKNRKQ